MKKNLIIAVILLGSSLFAQNSKDSTNILNPRILLDEADKAFTLDGVYSRSILTVIKNGNPQAPQIMEGYKKNAPDGTNRSLSIFLDPPRVSGTAYLMLGDDLWVRFASTGRVRKLSSSARKNSAAGSDFSYADMGDGGQSFTRDYKPSHDGMEGIEGRNCYRIVLMPQKKDAPYEKMIVWISVDSKRYEKVEYYSKGAPVKYMILEDYRPVGSVSYPFKVVMTSLVKKSSSVLETELMEYDSSRVQEKFFGTSWLESIR